MDAYAWIKALHLISVIAWMAGLFYLPRLFVYHAERATAGGELDGTFQIMEAKLLRVIMNPAMIASWSFGLALVAYGRIDWASIWPWAKALGVVAMTAFHMWLARERKAFASGAASRSGRTYRLMNEVPTVLLVLIVVAVIVRPF